MKTLAKIQNIKNPLSFVQDGVSVWTPRHANTVFEKCRYHRNRDESKAKMHIEALARQMANGEWLPRSPLDFARLPNGQITLVNGHHRLLAQVKSGVDIEWQIIIHDCADENEVENLFWRFDTVLRKRSIENVLNAVNYATDNELSKQAAKALSSAVIFIDRGMRPNHGQGAITYTPAEKLRLMDEWSLEAIHYEAAISVGINKARSKFFGMQTMAVALVTFRFQQLHAEAFWGGMAEDDGLRRGDPRKTLLEFLRENNSNTLSRSGMAMACVRCWNSWREGRDLTLIRIGNSVTTISGTPVQVMP